MPSPGRPGGAGLLPRLRRSLGAAGLVRPGLLTAGLAALLLASPLPAAGDFRVRILFPRPTDAVIGSTEIVVEATPPAGASLLKIEIYVDDRLVGTLLDPPWRLRWDPGDALRAHRIRAKAYASDGANVSHRVTTQALRGVQRAQVTLVEVYATVRDSGGGYITDLAREDFSILESGVPVDIAVFSADRKPVHLVLLFDSSASMGREGRLETAQEAARGFVEALEPGDTAVLIAFDDLPRILQEKTADKKALTAAIDAIEAAGGTALYDALMAAVEQLEGKEGRKAIILISDGRDESSSGMGPGSITTFEEALDAVLVTETMVYTIGTGAGLEEDWDYHHRRTLGEIMGTLAGMSGGRSWFVKKASKLKSAYRKVEDELRHQYTLAYYPPAEAPPVEDSEGRGAGWRSIAVKVTRPRARVTARTGYYAR